MKVAVPVKTISTLNAREHWSKKSARAKLHRSQAALALRVACVPRAPATAVVTITRIAPRPLDGDNLQGSLKSVRDGVADWLQIDDGSARVEWRYAQRKGAPKTYSVEVEVTS
ncbi:hypothetical protein C4F17_12335 [Variovorax sp. PMC12]|nr:hypothetical protein C4F17_12335 [Variovorax sp. PMC12]